MSSIEVDPRAGKQVPPDNTPVNPWPGLASYTEEQRDLFFGRERETAELLRLIERETLTVLFGRSGLGKTSLLRAGVIPRLRMQGYLPVILRLDYSGTGLPPVEQVKALVIEQARNAGMDLEDQPIADPLLKPEGRTLWEFFHTVEFWGPRNDRFTPILIFDQFEEVFTIGRGVQEAYDFLEQLADLVENRVPRAVEERIAKSNERLKIESSSEAYKVLISLREDFVPKLDSLRRFLPAIMRNRLGLQALDSDRALEVIMRAGREWVSEDVARRIVAAVAGQKELEGDFPARAGAAAEIEPAYLSVMCHELFRRMIALERPAITRDLVAQEHGGILERLYERSFEGLGPKVRHFVEDRLVTASGFRGTAPVAEALQEGLSRSDLDTLVDRRLLRFEDRLGTLHVELSHDLLTRVVQASREQRRELALREAERQEKAKLRRQLVRTRVRGAIAAGTAAIAVGVLIFFWLAYVHENVRYGLDYVQRFGEMRPLGPSSSAPEPHRTWSLRFIRRGFLGKVLTVQEVDSAGQLTARHNIGTYFRESGQQEPEREKECQWKFIYDPNGRVVYEIALDRLNRMVYGMVYSPSGNSKGDLVRKAMFVGPDGYPQPQLKTRAEYIEIHYDQEGNEIRRFFNDREGNVAPGPDQAFGRSLEYDREGHTTKEISLDANRQPMNDEYGNATLVLEYDRAGNEISHALFDTAGKLTLGKDGWAKVTYRNDQWGNTVETRYFDEYLRPVVDTDSGAYVWKYKYDDRGNLIEERAYEADGDTPMITQPSSSSVFRCHLWKTTYDSNNLAISYTAFDVSGKPLTSSDGWHKRTLVRDKDGFVQERDFFDASGHPIDVAEGYQKVTRKADDYGQPIEERYFHANGSPALTGEGHYHIWQGVYGKRGNLIQSSVYGVNGEPISDASGIHRWTKFYNRFGNPTRIECYGDDHGRRVLSHEGYFAETTTYDDRTGRYTTDQYWGTDGEPVPGPDGVAQRNYEYDDARGMMTEIRNSGVDGKPVGDKTGVWRSTMQYNAKRLRTRLERFGIDNKPAADKDGVYLEIAEYSEAGRMTRLTQLGKDGKGVWDGALGIATERDEYDADGNSSNTYYAADGSLRNLAAGYAIRRRQTDSNGHLLKEEFQDQKQQLTYGPQGYRKWEKRGSEISVDGKVYDSEERAKEDLNRTVVPLIYARNVTPGSVAASAGLRGGDVLWRLGSFYYPEAVARFRGTATQSDDLYNSILGEFRKARDASAKRSSTLIVLRDVKPVALPMQAHAGKPLGVTLTFRLVSYGYYEANILKVVAH